MSYSEELTRKLKNHTACVGVIGLGYVGLPLALTYSKAGFKVLGFDIDAHKVRLLNSGCSYIERINELEIAAAREFGFEATSDFSEASVCDALIICVPTPLTRYREPDISFIVNTMESLQPHLRVGQIISLESTTYPGTTEEELLPRIEAAGLSVGHNCFLTYSPEREDPGNPKFETRTIPKVVGGHSKLCLSVGVTLYEQAIDKVVPVSNTKTAEMTKLLENIHRAVNIGLVNEMKLVADRMDIDIFEVIDAAATKPFGFTPFYPGPGLGGHCIPIDPFYLTWKAREFGVNTRFIELSGEVNRAMPQHVVSKLIHGLNQHGKAISGSKILILGISYKKNVDDMRESPSVAIMEIIKQMGGYLTYSDPHVPAFPKMREHYFDLQSNQITKEMLSGFDAVIVATNHDDFDYELIKKYSSLIIDTRGVYRDKTTNIISA